ncbi:MAG: type IVB secretion system protein IcmH/DotU [Pseudomonadales bacterium]|nr:type IVB secretion system protein IcmH/DotU [Pseudomonadales bacterium]
MSDDPYQPPDNDKTIIRPMPGGRRGKSGQNAEAKVDGAQQDPFSDSDIFQPAKSAPKKAEPQGNVFLSLGMDRGALHPNAESNGFLASSSGLLSFAVKLRSTAANQDVNAIYQQCVDGVKSFEQKLTSFGVPHQQIVSARYMLCSFVDEAILSTPWGSRSGWDRRTLLSTFQNEVQGGEKFFDIVTLLSKEPRQYVELLGFAHACLALGFKGKYRLVDNGEVGLRSLKDGLYHLVQQTQGEPEFSLSHHLPDDDISNHGGKARFPLWVVAALTASLLILSYTAFLFSANRVSDPLANRLAAVGLEIPALIKKPRPRLKSASSLLALENDFSAEIRSNEISIIENSHKVLITLRGKGLFESGSVSLTNSRKELLSKLSKKIKDSSVDILVVGHTDNVPIRSVAFPSNWHLSKARAQSVASLLQEYLPERRIAVEGLADREPVAPNTSADNRAKNRRVEITLFKL